MKAPLNLDDSRRVSETWDIVGSNGSGRRCTTRCARLRFVISGHLPNASGEDAEGFDLHTNSSCPTMQINGMGWLWDGDFWPEHWCKWELLNLIEMCGSWIGASTPFILGEWGNSELFKLIVEVAYLDGCHMMRHWLPAETQAVWAPYCTWFCVLCHKREHKQICISML